MVDAKSNDDSTPLMHTSGMGHDDLVACLIKDAGADAGHKNNIDSTAMHYAIGGGHNRVTALLLNLLPKKGNLTIIIFSI